MKRCPHFVTHRSVPAIQPENQQQRKIKKKKKWKRLLRHVPSFTIELPTLNDKVDATVSIQTKLFHLHALNMSTYSSTNYELINTILMTFISLNAIPSPNQELEYISTWIPTNRSLTTSCEIFNSDSNWFVKHVQRGEEGKKTHQDLIKIQSRLGWNAIGSLKWSRLARLDRKYRSLNVIRVINSMAAFSLRRLRRLRRQRRQHHYLHRCLFHSFSFVSFNFIRRRIALVMPRETTSKKLLCKRSLIPAGTANELLPSPHANYSLKEKKNGKKPQEPHRIPPESQPTSTIETTIEENRIDSDRNPIIIFKNPSKRQRLRYICANRNASHCSQRS